MKKFKKDEVVKDIKSRIFENFKVKILCFFLAIVMYFSVSIFQRSTKIYSSDLKIEDLKDYLVISNNIPQNIKIIAKDKQQVFNKVTEEDFNIRLNLSDIKTPNTYVRKIEWDIPDSMSSFFSSIKIDPKEIRIDIDKLSEKNVDVMINAIGLPANGYIEKSSSVEPSTVRIQGPESILNKIDVVKTETINLEGVMESFRRQVNLTAGYSNVKILGKAEVYYEIIEETDVIRLKFQEANFLNLKQQFKAKVIEDVIVTLKGPKNTISTVSKEDFVLSIDCANIVYPGEYSYEVNITKKPKNFEVISTKPERIKIRVENK
jgi:YbbR domain-containing protein